MSYIRPTDLPPPPEHASGPRPLHVHLHAKLVEPALLRGGVVIVIDALRASVTITAALRNGAACVVPTLSVEDALAEKARRERDPSAREGSPPPPAPSARDGSSAGHAFSPPRILLGGERGGVLIEGFDLDNSPFSYSADRVAGATVVFTTSNGTAALLHAQLAELILVGSCANLTAVCERVAHDPRPVHILCAGTRDEISMDDCLPAGAMVERLVARGRSLVSDDSARLAHLAYRGALAGTGGLAEAMRQSRGGRNLARCGLGRDVDFCATPDTCPVVPRFDATRGEITIER